MAPPNDKLGRLPGVLMIVDGATGKVIAADIMPDGKETYMSPIFYQENGKDFIIFGSGGETFGGNLFQTTLQQLMKEKIGDAKILLQKEKNGFVAPPVVVDITKDNIKDIVVNWHKYYGIKHLKGQKLMQVQLQVILTMIIQLIFSAPFKKEVTLGI